MPRGPTTVGEFSKRVLSALAEAQPVVALVVHELRSVGALPPPGFRLDVRRGAGKGTGPWWQAECDAASMPSAACPRWHAALPGCPGCNS